MFGDMTALEGLHVRNNELPFPGSLISTILAGAVLPVRHGYRTAWRDQRDLHICI
jgi:hypothetical protein